MPISIDDGLITEFEDCYHKEILTYVKYPPNESAQRCFAYPQYLFEKESLIPVAKRAFPDNGSLPMFTARSDAGEMRKKFGSIVVMTVNEEPDPNRYYPEDEQAVYNGLVNPHSGKGKSPIEFKALSKHPLSSKLMQVVEVEERNLDFSASMKSAVHLYRDSVAPQTDLILITQTNNGRQKYYGPFEWAEDQGAIKLSASSSYDNSVAGFNESAFKFEIKLVDDEGDLSSWFVSADEFSEKFASSADVFDWISSEDLLDAIGRISRSMEEPFTKAQMRNLKSAVSKCADNEAKIHLTNVRREKMLSLLGNYEQWSSLPSEVKRDAIERADPAQLAEYVLNDDHFAMFFEKVSEVDSVCSKLEQERVICRDRYILAKKEADDAQAKKAEAERELESYEKSIDEKRQELEKEVAEKTEAAKRERDCLKQEVCLLTEDKKKLEEDKIILERQIRRVIEGMSDELSVSNKILESAMIKQIVTSLSEESLEENTSGEISAGVFAAPIHICDNESELSDSELIDRIEHLVCEFGGRDFTRNEIINLMICLNQGYILTLAGLPGTGKTSLASILAGALGLNNAAAKRFAEVSVERGWTSYKDFVGYYNPLTGTMEKSNAVVFDAFSMLSKEANAALGLDEVAPYFLLLDEANLSSIEHYWAPFLRACDSFRSGPIDLSLGGEDSLRLPSYLRFIASVNFDHTTEELSPRFLDRSWVVTLDPDAFDFEGDDLAFSTPDYSFAPAYSVARLQRTFGTKSDANMKSAFKSKMKEVLEICSKHCRPVSPRSQKMIWNYICTAEVLMDQSTAQTSYSPVDYAISQKVLPMLAGTEEKVEKLLDELGSIDKLPITKSRVAHVLEVGNDSGYYQYFA